MVLPPTQFNWHHAERIHFHYMTATALNSLKKKKANYPSIILTNVIQINKLNTNVIIARISFCKYYNF